MQLISGSDTITIDNPQYGYTVNLQMAIEIQRFGNVVGAWDNGSEYDQRNLSMDLKIPSTQMVELVDFFNDTDARFDDFSLVLGSNSRFYPAGPDKGDEGTYTVSLFNKNESGMMLAPFKYFENGLQLLIHNSPATALPTPQSEGPFSIGTAHGLRYPDITPTSEQAVIRSKSLAGIQSNVNLGSSADGQSTSISQPCNTSNAAALVNFLQNGGRDNGIFVDAPESYFLFGAECGSSGGYTTKLINNTIQIRHTNHDIFEIDLELWRDNG